MNQPLIIGVTGGIGGGKSTFCRFLAKSNQFVYNTDNEAKRIQETESQVIKAIKQEFGDDIYQNGSLQRSKLGSIVFADSQKLQKLNNIVHPAVIRDFQQWIKEHSDRKFLFMECAVLFEAQLTQYVDKIVVVTASEKERIKRTMQRDNLSKKQVKLRINNQLPENDKIANADWVFDTTHSINLMKYIEEFVQILDKINDN